MSAHPITEEKFRGFLTSVLSGGIGGGVNLLSVGLGVNPTLSAFYSLYLVGNVVAYVSDIMFAKKDFGVLGGAVPYTDFVARGRWLLKSFISPYFYRFILTVIFDTVIGLALLKSLINMSDRYGILVDWKWRDMFISGFVALFTFFLYTNVLRFDWAYKDGTSQTMDMLVLMSVATSLLIFSQSYQSSDILDPTVGF